MFEGSELEMLRRTRISLLLSLILHAIFVALVALYIPKVREKVGEALSVSFHRAPAPRKVVPRKPPVMPKPQISPTESPVSLPAQAPQPREARRGFRSAKSEAWA